MKPVVKAKRGEIRDMVLPGGGDVRTRIWAIIRVKINALAKRQRSGAFNTSASIVAIRKLEEFSFEEDDLGKHVWEEVPNQEALQIKVEISVLIDSFEQKKIYNTNDSAGTVSATARKSKRHQRHHSHEEWHRTTWYARWSTLTVSTLYWHVSHQSIQRIDSHPVLTHTQIHEPLTLPLGPGQCSSILLALTELEIS